MTAEKCLSMNFPGGTRVQILEYLSESGPAALAHQFLYRENTIGAAGKPGPKYVICLRAQLTPMLPSTGQA